jgi:hypothetical protein
MWTDSVNAFPRQLGLLNGSPKRIAKLSAKGSKQQGEEPETDDEGEVLNLDLKEFALADVRRLTDQSYDLSKCLGKLLRTRFKFISLKGIRKAYSVAFSEKIRARPTGTKAIDAALSDKSLDALSVVRNVIVHSGGTADQCYETDCKGVPLAPQLKRGEKLELDGELCVAILDQTMDCCKNLLTAVDDWLVAVGGKTHGNDGKSGDADAGNSV